MTEENRVDMYLKISANMLVTTEKPMYNIYDANTSAAADRGFSLKREEGK